MRHIYSVAIVAMLGLAASACSQQGPAPSAANAPTDVGNMAYPTPSPAGVIRTTTVK